MTNHDSGDAQSMQQSATCPVCGKVGVKACVDAQGHELTYDHPGRPPFFPPGFDDVWPTP